MYSSSFLAGHKIHKKVQLLMVDTEFELRRGEGGGGGGWLIALPGFLHVTAPPHNDGNQASVAIKVSCQ